MKLRVLPERSEEDWEGPLWATISFEGVGQSSEAGCLERSREGRISSNTAE